MVWTVLFVVAVGLTTVLAAVTDLQSRRIPNYLTVPAALAGLAYHATCPSGMGIGLSLAGFGIGFALLLIPWLAGGGGMGDVKLLAALGAWLGPRPLLAAFCLSVVMGTVILIGLSFRGIANGSFLRKHRNTMKTDHKNTNRSTRRPRRTLPFAVPMALGTWTVLAWFVANGGW
ncbi:MAG: prepilin peptidase [Pirellulales bacterium]|nr:prepilin peptidase [Pirellulales bacterium]